MFAIIFIDCVTLTAVVKLQMLMSIYYTCTCTCTMYVCFLNFQTPNRIWPLLLFPLSLSLSLSRTYHTDCQY